MNISNAFKPSKDEKTNRIIPSIIQCFDKTHFIINETKLEQGVLNYQYIYINYFIFILIVD